MYKVTLIPGDGVGPEIAEATRNGGFPPLLVNPIDFADLLRREHERALREQEAGGAPQPTAQA